MTPLGKRDEALKLHHDGLDPIQIATQQGVSLATILGYLNDWLGRGQLRRTDILFSVDEERRRNPQSEGEEYREVLERYGNAAHAFGDMYEDLRCIEVELHKRIRKACESKFGDGDRWWRLGLSENLRKKLAGRREEDESPEDHAYRYTDLLDLAEILDKNWGQVAAEVVPNSSDKQVLLRDLRRLNQIRRKVMHPVRSTPPSEKDFKFVRQVRQHFRI